MSTELGATFVSDARKVTKFVLIAGAGLVVGIGITYVDFHYLFWHWWTATNAVKISSAFFFGGIILLAVAGYLHSVDARTWSAEGPKLNSQRLQRKTLKDQIDTIMVFGFIVSLLFGGALVGALFG